MLGRDMTHPRLDAVADLIRIYREACSAGSVHNYERHMLGELMTGEGPTEERLNNYARRLLKGETYGFTVLRDRGLLHLTMENLVANRDSSYHKIWDEDLVEMADARLAEVQDAAA